jgi:hypothetical protein
MKTVSFATLLIVLSLSAATPAQTPDPKTQETSCRTFVQGFYDWYVAHGTKLETAMKVKRSALSRELADALAADLAASAKSADDIVGIDFDPFINSQDPARRYQVGKTTASGDGCSAEVFGIARGKKGAKPDVTAELRAQGATWQFTNFHYGLENGPGDENLLAILSRLKSDREKGK